MEKKLNGFPESPGLYICQNSTDIIIVKITGVYPCLQINRGFRLDTMITGSRLEEATKEQLASIELDPTSWKWHSLNLDTSVFPKQSFAFNRSSFSKDEYYLIRAQYYRLVREGVGYSKIQKFLVYKYNLTMDETRDLINNFDAEAAYKED